MKAWMIRPMQIASRMTTGLLRVEHREGEEAPGAREHGADEVDRLAADAVGEPADSGITIMCTMCAITM